MRVFDPEQPDAKVAAWRTYPDEPDIRIRLNPITRDDVRRLRKKATRNGRTDEALLDKLLCREAVAGEWEGFVDPQGEPLPCTVPIVDALMARFTGLANWAVEEACELAERMAAERGDALKNSATSPDMRSDDRTGSDHAKPAA